MTAIEVEGLTTHDGRLEAAWGASSSVAADVLVAWRRVSWEPRRW